MRRASDRKHSERTGHGRRARDQLLAGTSVPSEALRNKLQGADVKDLALFLGDDLRESAIAMGSIESFLIGAQRALAREDLTVHELRQLVHDDEIVARLELLSDALSSLRQSMDRIYQAVEAGVVADDVAGNERRKIG